MMKDMIKALWQRVVNEDARGAGTKKRGAL
jgi:hypothetical protein